MQAALCARCSEAGRGLASEAESLAAISSFETIGHALPLLLRQAKGDESAKDDEQHRADQRDDDQGDGHMQTSLENLE